MSFSNMIQDAVEGALSGHNNNNNRDSNRHDNNSNDNRDDNDNEFNPAARYAESHTNTSSGDTSLFTSALSFLNENKHRLASSDINEQEMIQAHQSVYGGDSNNEPRQHDANSVGAGAAMQALKMFTTSSEGEKSGMDKNAFIGMAMAQAKKMFEEKEARGEVNGDKQSAINTAAEMALKMYLKSGGGGMAGTGGPGGGLLSLASKFL